jgi:hypothetical protein
MAEITNDFMGDVLQAHIGEVKKSLRVANVGLNAITGHAVGLRQDLSNIFVLLTRYESRLDRIEHRLDFVEVT